MGTPNHSSAAPHMGREEHGRADSGERGGKRGEWGSSQLSAENFESRREGNTLRVNSSPTSKELGWKQPFDGGKFALMLHFPCWHGKSDPAPQQAVCSSEVLSKKEKEENKEGNCALLLQLSFRS